jgi:hypothetical protein
LTLGSGALKRTATTPPHVTDHRFYGFGGDHGTGKIVLTFRVRFVRVSKCSAFSSAACARRSVSACSVTSLSRISAAITPRQPGHRMSPADKHYAASIHRGKDGLLLLFCNASSTSRSSVACIKVSAPHHLTMHHPLATLLHGHARLLARPGELVELRPR